MRYALFVVVFSLFLIKCAQNSPRNDANTQPKPTGLSGKELAEIHCGRCHLLPSPDLIDRATWQNKTLPEMAFYLGIRPFKDKMFEGNPDDIPAMIQSGLFPNNPLLVEEDWQKIVEYYTTNAPEKPLPQKQKERVKEGLALFNTKISSKTEGLLPFITLVKIDTAKQQFYIAQRERAWVDILSSTFKKIDSIKVGSPVSDLQLRGGERYILEMGLMDPNDVKKGKLIKVNTQNQSTTLVNALPRPVHLNITDMNQDGVEDFLICNYGNYMGNLAWYDGKTFQENLLSSLPGARVTHIRDMNNDGLADIVALFCQARERVSIFYNKGNGRYDETIVLEFPPIYGSSYIDLADMNADGKPDIVYTSGDNADYSITLKPFHGVYIFINDGQNQFKEQFFYPIFGAGKVCANDFDKDGDLDLAVTAFFPDAKQKANEGFLFLENKNNFKFSASTFSESSRGRWLVMDVGDIDGDSKKDVILGSFFKNIPTVANAISFVLLKNK